MANPTDFIGTLQENWDDMLSFTETLQDHEQKARFARYRRFFIKLVVQAAISGSVPDAEVFLQQNRKFLTNTTGSSIFIEGAGQEWEFPAGVTYMCSPEELDFFLGKCIELGIPGLIQDTYAVWVAFAQDSYFWS